MRTKGLIMLLHQAFVFSGTDRIEFTSQEYDTYADSKSDRKVGDRVSIMSGTR